MFFDKALSVEILNDLFSFGGRNIIMKIMNFDFGFKNLYPKTIKLNNLRLCPHTYTYTSVKYNVNLIISSHLIDTPKSDTMAIRYLTSFSRCDLKLYNLIEVEQELKDSYYTYMKNLGLMDYVDYYITPEEYESGLRLDIDFNYTNTIKTNCISLNNVHLLKNQLKIFR